MYCKCTYCGGECIPFVDEDMSCRCFIVAPCAKCIDDRVQCIKCGDIYYPEDVNKLPILNLNSIYKD